MNLTKIIAMPFSAEITIGLEKGCTQELLPKEEVISFYKTTKAHCLLIKKSLSTAVIDCTLVFSGQREPHLKINFINYQTYPLPEKQFKKEIELLTVYLINKLQQNRVVVQFRKETIMFEKNKTIDPRI